MTHLLIIGGTSTDILHLDSKIVPSAGGAGMYTAMAAHRCQTHVSLFAPHPNPIPDILQPIAERLTEWLGPIVDPEEVLPEPPTESGYTPCVHPDLASATRR